MRIPKDIPLAAYIRKLINSGNIEKFYFGEDWKELRQRVMEAYHFECQECLKRGEYTRAVCVHHVNEVRHHPHLALSRWYVNPITGRTEPNLIPLCNTCHNLVHEKLIKYQRKDKFVNEERW